MDNDPRRPLFVRHGGYLGQTRLPNEDAEEVDDGNTSDSSLGSFEHLETHIVRNGRLVDTKFFSYKVCPVEKIFFHQSENESKRYPLHASDVDAHKLLAPQLYRIGAPFSIISLVLRDQLESFLSGIDSVIPRQAFEAKRSEIRKAFEQSFVRRPVAPRFLLVEGKEEVFRGQISEFLHSIARIVGGSDYHIPIGLEDMTGAGGVVCKVGSNRQVDLHAGIMSFMDLKLKYGHPKYDGKTLFVAEIKKMKSSGGNVAPRLNPLWYRNGAAMCGQLHVALIGEDAPIGLAIMPEGYKFVLRARYGADCSMTLSSQEDDRSLPFRSGCFSDYEGLADYAPGHNTQAFCDVMA